MTDDLRNLIHAYDRALSAQSSVAGLRLRLTHLQAASQKASTEEAAARKKSRIESAQAQEWQTDGIKAFFWNLIADLERRRETEHAEAVAAAADLAVKHQAVLSLRAQQDKAERELATHEALAAGVGEAQRQALTAISATLPGWSGRIDAALKRKSDLERQIKETGEAVEACGSVTKAVRSALASFDSAGNWGTYDLFVGGGWIASSIKRSHVEEGLTWMSSINSRLQRLRTEMADIPTPVAPPSELEMGSGHWTLDVWFDNFFSDWIMQGKIQEVRERLRALARKLTQLSDQLNQRWETLERDLSTAADEIDAILSEAAALA